MFHRAAIAISATILFGVTARAVQIGTTTATKWGRVARCNDVREAWNGAAIKDRAARKWWSQAMAEACRGVPASLRIAVVD